MVDLTTVLCCSRYNIPNTDSHNVVITPVAANDFRCDAVDFSSPVDVIQDGTSSVCRILHLLDHVS